MSSLIKLFVHKFPFLEKPVIVLLYGYLFWLGPWALFKKYRFFKRAIVVPAVIQHAGNDCAEVTYILDGSVHTVTVDYVCSSRKRNQGKQIVLAVNPYNLQEAYAKQFRADLPQWIMTAFFVFGLFCFLMAVIAK